MKLVLFDIDGTVVDSVAADDHCYVQSIEETFGIQLRNVDWSTYPHVTDSGLLTEIVREHFNRAPGAEEIAEMKARFTRRIAVKTHAFSEIRGAVGLVHYLDAQSDFEIAFATGGWYETAVIKLKAVGIDPEQFILRSASDFMERENIVKAAVEACALRNPGREFASVTYFGDGIWDYTTTNKLGFRFIGIDGKGNGKLTAAGAPTVLADFTPLSEVLELL